VSFYPATTGFLDIITQPEDGICDFLTQQVGYGNATEGISQTPSEVLSRFYFG